MIGWIGVFLSKILISFGFGKKLVALVSQLISTPRFSVLINGSPSPLFDCSRGLRKGDPISPFFYNYGGVFGSPYPKIC